MSTLILLGISLIVYQPVNLLIIVVLQTINISVLMGMQSKNMIPMMIFLIWVGGLLIIFLYLSSLMNIISIYNSLISTTLVLLLYTLIPNYSTNNKMFNFVINQIEFNQLMMMVFVLMMIYNLNVLTNNIKTPLNDEL